MATLPPRKNPTPTKISKEHLTPLQILLQLGFLKYRAEKALAATGHRSVQLASDWLLAHVRDPTLKSQEPRVYILYACPTGPLAEQLARFWLQSKELEWNGAHNYLPHITLVPFFKAPDEYSQHIATGLETLVDRTNIPKVFRLEKYVSQNFMGLFLKEEDGEYFKNIAIRYTNFLATFGISAQPTTDMLHLTLAHQFSSGHCDTLRSMVEKLKADAMCTWELRLYSKDSRLYKLDVHKVLHPHLPREEDELELRPGDYIYLPQGASANSPDGWAEGVSWLTGTTGYLPLNHTMRTAESESWTLHATVPIIERRKNIPQEDILRRRPPLAPPSSSVDAPDGILSHIEPMEASEFPATSQRDILICRHGERVDFTFGTWIPYCFENDGTYIRRDLNMPETVPSRKTDDFKDDCPLTTLGEIQANMVGSAMKLHKVHIDVAFVSPSLRCIQTMMHLLKGLDLNIPMKIEPGLMEWLAWYQNGLPAWMTPKELTAAGFNIDESYEPIMQAHELPMKESAIQYYERSHSLIKSIIKKTEGNVLIVAHAISLPACTRQLTGGQVPHVTEVTKLVQQVPYLACLIARQGPKGWQLHPPPFPPITHSSNKRFDWKILM